MFNLIINLKGVKSHVHDNTKIALGSNINDDDEDELSDDSISEPSVRHNRQMNMNNKGEKNATTTITTTNNNNNNNNITRSIKNNENIMNENSRRQSYGLQQDISKGGKNRDGMPPIYPAGKNSNVQEQKYVSLPAITEKSSSNIGNDNRNNNNNIKFKKGIPVELTSTKSPFMDDENSNVSALTGDEMTAFNSPGIYIYIIN